MKHQLLLTKLYRLLCLTLLIIPSVVIAERLLDVDRLLRLMYKDNYRYYHMLSVISVLTYKYIIILNIATIQYVLYKRFIVKNNISNHFRSIRF